MYALKIYKDQLIRCKGLGATQGVLDAAQRLQPDRQAVASKKMTISDLETQ